MPIAMKYCLQSHSNLFFLLGYDQVAGKEITQKHKEYSIEYEINEKEIRTGKVQRAFSKAMIYQNKNLSFQQNNQKLFSLSSLTVLGDYFSYPKVISCESFISVLVFSGLIEMKDSREFSEIFALHFGLKAPLVRVREPRNRSINKGQNGLQPEASSRHFLPLSKGNTGSFPACKSRPNMKTSDFLVTKSLLLTVHQKAVVQWGTHHLPAHSSHLMLCP